MEIKYMQKCSIYLKNCFINSLLINLLQYDTIQLSNHIHLFVSFIMLIHVITLQFVFVQCKLTLIQTLKQNCSFGTMKSSNGFHDLNK